METAKEVLGHKKRHQTDRFRENIEIIEPFLQIRNQLYARWFSSGRASDRQKFMKAKGCAQSSERC